jgi:hypothetical protein
LTQQFSRKFVNIGLLPGSATADCHDENGDLSSLYPVNDPVSLPDGADTAEAGELADERLALLLGRPGELLGALSDETSDALIGDRLDQL